MTPTQEGSPTPGKAEQGKKQLSDEELIEIFGQDAWERYKAPEKDRKSLPTMLVEGAINGIVIIIFFPILIFILPLM